MKRKIVLILSLAVTLPAFALSDITMPVNLEKLGARATESVDVNLDASMLQLASKFL